MCYLLRGRHHRVTHNTGHTITQMSIPDQLLFDLMRAGKQTFEVADRRPPLSLRQLLQVLHCPVLPPPPQDHLTLYLNIKNLYYFQHPSDPKDNFLFSFFLTQSVKLANRLTNPC